MCGEDHFGREVEHEEAPATRLPSAFQMCSNTVLYMSGTLKHSHLLLAHLQLKYCIQYNIVDCLIDQMYL